MRRTTVIVVTARSGSFASIKWLAAKQNLPFDLVLCSHADRLNGTIRRHRRADMLISDGTGIRHLSPKVIDCRFDPREIAQQFELPHRVVDKIEMVLDILSNRYPDRD
ncbi:MAG: hypothetical protein WAN50_03350 [Minisyncoccia bacterium]